MTLAVPAVVDPVDADGYFDALERADEPATVAVAIGLLDAGVPAQEVLLRLVGPAQVRVGQLWQHGRWSVAQEHAATAIAERVVAAVGARTRSAGPRSAGPRSAGPRGTPRGAAARGHVVVSCLDGEWHALAARLAGEVLRLHGWRVTFLGASVPPTHLVSFLQQHAADVVALSAALPIHLPAARPLIAAAQRTGTPVLAGGPGFGADGAFARRLGVDAWASTADDAVALLDRRPWPSPECASVTAAHTEGEHTEGEHAEGEHAEGEHAGLRQRRGRLVVAAMERLRDRSGLPVLLADSAPSDDLGQVVDFLATAAYLRDRTVFTDHLAWLTTVSCARGALAGALADLLAAFADDLAADDPAGFPFARSCVEAGYAVVAGG